MTVEYDARGLTLTLTISVDADIRGNAVGAWGNCLCINSCRSAIFARNFLPIAQSWFREHDEASQVDRGDNVRRFHGVTPGCPDISKGAGPKVKRDHPTWKGASTGLVAYRNLEENSHSGRLASSTARALVPHVCDERLANL